MFTKRLSISLSNSAYVVSLNKLYSTSYHLIRPCVESIVFQIFCSRTFDQYREKLNFAQLNAIHPNGWSFDCEMYLKFSYRRASGIKVPAKSSVSRRFFYKSTGNLSVSCFLCLISSIDPWKKPFEQVASSLTAGEGKFTPNVTNF